MKRALALAAVIVFVAAPLCAHRLDEYLQATIFSLEPDHIHASMRLMPGVATFPAVMQVIDTNADGVLSADEQRAYAKRVLADLSLRIDDKPLTPVLLSVTFPSVEGMKEGTGEIQIEFTASIPPGSGPRTLAFANHHERAIAVYLANCLEPRDPNIRIDGQTRNEQQSLYLVHYEQTDDRTSSGRTNMFRLSGFFDTFSLGIRHIAEGTDHLLFLLALLLSAPVIAAGKRWDGFGGVRPSLTKILKIVTAFTLGHSVTLALAATGTIKLPSRPVEVCIAVSILVSALHAIRPIFPGREAAIAAFFGLIHGMAFATTLDQLGLTGWHLVAGLAGFNLGIEAMQLAVVAATVPSLLLLARTQQYSLLRVGGGIVAAVISAGWILERLLNLQSAVDLLVGNAAQYAPWIAVLLFLSSLVCCVFTPKPQLCVPGENKS